jgi:uncharacterized membrane-anchored protein YitT (DUF2179 family)
MNQKHQRALRCEIITENPGEMSRAIIDRLHHSATLISAKGAYTGADKSVLLCIINPSQVTELTKLVDDFPGSFVTVSSATRVLGNFKRLDSQGNPQQTIYDKGKKLL